MQVLASQLHFLANKNAELAIPPLFWPVNCIKIGGHVALLSDPTVYSLYCDKVLYTLEFQEVIVLISMCTNLVFLRIFSLKHSVVLNEHKKLRLD